jgi:diguanylate cyclase (GGDEF)-like protein
MTEQMRVLIVDDEKMNRDLLVALLKPLYRVMVAKSGEQALKAASRVMGKPDIILLDIMMPDMDGYEVCRRLKANEESMNIPVIFVTAMGEVEDESKGFSLGAVDYIIKPVSLPIVQARVNTHLRLKHKTDLLERMAFLDGLTEIPNRRAFDTALHKEWNRAKRAAIPLAMIMMDVDKFKQYNDHYGHTAGDDCLKQLAATLAGVIRRPGDMVARYGGEEFCALLIDTDLQGAVKVAEKFRARVELLQIKHNFSVPAPVVTISVGVAAIIPDRDEDVSPLTLQEQADSKLYLAKEAGRNRIMS